MYTRIFSGPANRCVRSQGNRARQGDSDRKAGRKEARTFAMTMEVRAAGAASLRPSARPLCKRWRARLSVSCDTKLDVPRSLPFLWPFPGLAIDGPAIELMRARQKQPKPYRRPARIGSNG